MKNLVGILALLSSFAVSAAPTCSIKMVAPFREFRVEGGASGQCLKPSFIVVANVPNKKNPKKKTEVAFKECYPSKARAEFGRMDLQGEGKCRRDL
jgi:hypothetical protein